MSELLFWRYARAVKSVLVWLIVIGFFTSVAAASWTAYRMYTGQAPQLVNDFAFRCLLVYGYLAVTLWTIRLGITLRLGLKPAKPKDTEEDFTIDESGHVEYHKASQDIDTVLRNKGKKSVAYWDRQLQIYQNNPGLKNILLNERRKAKKRERNHAGENPSPTVYFS